MKKAKNELFSVFHQLCVDVCAGVDAIEAELSRMRKDNQK